MPPAMGPVFEPFHLEVGKTVGVGEALPVGPAGWVEELEGLTSAPAGISGVSEKYRFATVHEKQSG